MEKRVDLEKSLEELEEYTEREAARELGLLERHLINIYKGEKVAFCVACLKKHILGLSGLAGECLEGSCRPKKLWHEIADWANEIENKIPEIGPKKEITLEIAQKARQFRKTLLEDIDKLKREEPSDEKEHVG